MDLDGMSKDNLQNKYLEIQSLNIALLRYSCYISCYDNILVSFFTHIFYLSFLQSNIYFASMETNQSSIAILADAKEEYTRQLINILRTPMYIGIQSIYNDAKSVCQNDNKPNDVLMVFQDLLSRIPKWSQEIINQEYTRITDSSKCDWIEDLLKVIYVAHIKVLTIVNSAQKNKKISLKIPTGGHFAHLCYIELAREFWKNPYLFSDRVSKLEYQKNMRECEAIISNCIVETIRKQLPVRHILKEYFGDDDDTVKEEAISGEDEDIKKAISPRYLKKIETIVKRELKSSDNYETGMEDTIRQIIKDELAKQQKPPSEEKPVDTTLVATITEKVIEQTGGVNADDTADNTPIKTDNTASTADNTASTTTTTKKNNTTDSLQANNDSKPVSNPVAIPPEPKETAKKPESTATSQQTPQTLAPATNSTKLGLSNIPDVSTSAVAPTSATEDVKSISITAPAKKSATTAKTSLEQLLVDSEQEQPSKDTPLQINDITDVNLNLNELDIGDLDNELEEVNLEVKSDPNIEYKFF